MLMIKTLITVGVAAAVVAGLFIMGHYLDKDAEKKEKEAAEKTEQADKGV